MNRHGMKAWLYLLPALLFLSIFMIYPLIDVFVYSAEEGYNFASQTYFGTGLYNYSYVLHDPYFAVSSGSGSTVPTTFTSLSAASSTLANSPQPTAARIAPP